MSKVLGLSPSAPQHTEKCRPGSQSFTLLAALPYYLSADFRRFPNILSPESRCKSLIHPVFLPMVGHGSQGGVSCCQASPEDNAVMQAVGLALPELYHLGVQDVATPMGRSRALLCPPPLSSQALLQEAPGMSWGGFPREGDLPPTRVPFGCPSGTGITYQYSGLGTSCSW